MCCGLTLLSKLPVRQQRVVETLCVWLLATGTCPDHVCVWLQEHASWAHAYCTAYCLYAASCISGLCRLSVVGLSAIRKPHISVAIVAGVFKGNILEGRVLLWINGSLLNDGPCHEGSHTFRHKGAAEL
jgi:hypothetical protein